jgi:hypothetical protein
VCEEECDGTDEDDLIVTAGVNEVEIVWGRVGDDQIYGKNSNYLYIMHGIPQKN